MKLSRTLLPASRRRLSSPFITVRDYGVRCSVKSMAVCSVKNLFPIADFPKRTPKGPQLSRVSTNLILKEINAIFTSNRFHI